MSRTINFELVSPERKLISEPVFMAVIPGDEGMFGVKPGHCSLVVSLKSGVVKMYKTENGEPAKIFIAGGFADVSAENCTILAEEAVNVKDLDQAKLDQELANLTEDLGMAEETADKRRIQAKIEVIKAKLKAISS